MRVSPLRLKDKFSRENPFNHVYLEEKKFLTYHKQCSFRQSHVHVCKLDVETLCIFRLGRGRGMRVSPLWLIDKFPRENPLNHVY